MDIKYISDDKHLDASTFIHMANQVWPGTYNPQYTQEALDKTINITAWDNGDLIGCIRVLSDGYFFGTITEILIVPKYQLQGVGKKLMALAFEASPTSLFFGAQPEAEGFYEKLGYKKSIQSFGQEKPRRQ